MVDATPGTICRLKANADSGQSPRRVGPTPRNPDTEYPKFSSPGGLLDGSKRDVCVVRNFADVDGVAHKARLCRHALCRTVCLGHRGKPPAVDESLHDFPLAPSTRHDPHSCAHAQLNVGHLRQFPSFQASAPATWALRFSGTRSRLCKQAPVSGLFFALEPTLIREGTHHETDAHQRHAG